MNDNRFLLVVSGPSGCGKDTVVRDLIEHHANIELAVSATTRPPRDDEQDGIDYFFITREEFEARINRGEFAEHTQYVSNYYGTLKSYIDEKINLGKDILFDLDVKGALSIKKIYKDKALLIFIKPPNKEVIRERLIKRGTESMETIENRLKRFDFEMEKITEFDYVVLNDDLQNAINEVQKIINKYKSGVN